MSGPSPAELHESRFGAVKWREGDFHIGSYRFCSVLYMRDIYLKTCDMPCGNFEEIVNKYRAFFFVRPFASHNMSTLRLWLDEILKNSRNCVVDWNKINAKKHEKLLMLSNLNTVALRLQLAENLKGVETQLI